MPQHAPLAISLKTQVCTFLLGGYVWLLFSAAIYMLVTLSCSLCVNVTTRSLHWESKLTSKSLTPYSTNLLLPSLHW